VFCDGDQLVAAGRTHTTVLPPETIVHELRDADLDSSEGVARLLSTLGLDFAQPLDLIGLGLWDRCTVHASPLPAPPTIMETWCGGPDLVVAVTSRGPEAPTLHGVGCRDDGGLDPDMTLPCGHWRQIAQRLRLVRGAVNHFVAYDEGAELGAAWSAQGFEVAVDHGLLPLPSGRRPDLAHLSTSIDADAWRVFIAAHAQLLRDQLPSLTVCITGQRERISMFALPSGLASALMVQLHNLIVDGLPIRRCANETCGRPFTRQRGRSLRGRSRQTGVIYCDAACAKAQLQREYRRRNRQRAENIRAVAVRGSS
jgi:hypothetical protein